LDDTTYLPSDIIAAIRDYTGATPDLDCGGQGRVQLDEVHFCLDKTLQVSGPMSMGDEERV
jgi:hypothetical protein